MAHVSVIIPLYNKEDAISNTIKSVLQQTYTNFELIIINDGSTDRSLEIVKSINDNRIQIYTKKMEALVLLVTMEPKKRHPHGYYF